MNLDTVKVGFIAVSYTHLDVYKRQGVDIKCVFVKYPYARQSEMGNMRLKNDAHTNYVRFSIYLFYR